MVRAPYYDKNGVKKGAWSREEDERLKAFIQIYGHSNWRLLPKFSGLERCGKSCRLRWLNYLRPNLKHGNYTQEEEEIIIRLHQKFGNKWSKIAEKLPGRTDNEVKNYWHSHLKKIKNNKEDTTSELMSTTQDDENSVEENETHEFIKSDSESQGASAGDDVYHILESSLVTETCEAGNYSLTSNVPQSNVMMNCFTSKEDNAVPPIKFDEFSGDFWTEPFVVEDMFTDQMCSGEGLDDTYFL